MKFKPIIIHTYKLSGISWTQDINLSGKEAGKLSYDKYTKIVKNNLGFFQRKLAEIRTVIYYRSSLYGEVDYKIKIAALFSEKETNMGLSYIGVKYILDELQKVGFEAYISKDEKICVSWDFKYPFYQWIRTPKGVKTKTLLLISMGLFVWLASLKWLSDICLVGWGQTILSYAKIIDPTFIAIAAAIWLGMKVPSYLEQRALYNNAFKDK